MYLLIKIIYLLTGSLVKYGAGHDVKGSTSCEFYNDTKCAESQEGCSKRETCQSPDPGKRNHCYVLWTYNNATNTSTIKLKVMNHYKKCLILKIKKLINFCLNRVAG